jgi:glycosyltransferase involved in cell wall biosynthesis
MLLLVHLPPPVNGVTMVSGQVVHARDLGRRFDVDVLPLRSAARIDDIGKLRPAKVLGIAALAGKLVVRLLFRRPDLVYFTLTPVGKAFYRDLIFVAIMKLLRVRRLYHLHGKGISSAQTHPLITTAYRWAFRSAETILLSPSLFEDASRVVAKERCHFLANGVPDPYDGREYRAGRTAEGGSPLILFLSNLVVNKGIFVLLEALALIRSRSVPFRASFVGAWESKAVEQEFRRVVWEKALDESVEVCGPRYGEDKHRTYAGADIMAFPTYNDSYPLVLLEAMSHGLPVVTAREGAIPDMIQDGITGYLVPRRDPQAVAQRLELLLVDPALREHMGKAGRERYLSCFTLDRFEKNLTSIVETCLATERSPDKL